MAWAQYSEAGDDKMTVEFFPMTQETLVTCYAGADDPMEDLLSAALDLDDAISMKGMVHISTQGTTTMTAKEWANESVKVDGGADAVVSASYGKEGAAGKDVTDKAREIVGAGGELRASNNLFGDPAPLQKKLLSVTVRVEKAMKEEGSFAEALSEVGLKFAAGETLKVTAKLED
eukprot:CAMPEP_0179260294 /NCGR_PEP_ID=MMETSP0797-20121207/26264_1 /TAXON_ID=47934 /ORGANISM="Dinophysis acuminata, Strain DAEP01" /LENGTH=174 /DNA_ID=CAMNT_0020968367 /DNA_START=72 /DNA_END=596 /DNA_ORIENTATION=+